jgi:hypothetical protein
MRAETSELISFSGAADPIPCVPDARPVSTPTLAESAPAGPTVIPYQPRSRFDIAAMPGLTRAEQIAMTLEQACADDRFCECIAQADAARDSGDWAVAAREYANALRQFPLHWGYCIQYAHTVKEQGLHPLAEAWYRSAVALGAPAGMVDEHLAFVARKNGAAFVRRGMPDLAVPPMQAPPTIHDIRLLAELTRVPGMGGEDLALDILRNLPDNRAVLVRMLAMPAFARANRLLLDILRD